MNNNIAAELNNSAAEAIITTVRFSLRKEYGTTTKAGKVTAGIYVRYVTEYSVTEETIAQHVKSLREAAYPGVKTDGKAPRESAEFQAKKFADRVRTGLRSALNVQPKKTVKSGHLLTTEGVNELIAYIDDVDTLAEMIRAELIARMPEA